MFRIETLLSLVAMLAPVTVALPQDGTKDKATTKPPYERLLAGTEADRAAELNRQIDQAQADDDYAQAIKLAGELLELRVRLQGDDHYETISMKHSLTALKKIAELTPDKREEWRTALAGEKAAERLISQAQYAQALPALKQMLEIRLTVLGEEHPDTASSYNDLADNLRSQGKALEAEAYYRKALEIRLRVLGDHHDDTGASYNNLALDLMDLGKVVEAEPLYRRALATCLHIIGEDQPDTIATWINLANNLGAQGKFVEAEPLIRIALEVGRRVLRDEDPQMIAEIHNSLALNLKSQGRSAEAEIHYLIALEICRRVFGEDYAYTATIYNNVARNMEAQGKADDAEVLLRKALEIRIRVQSEDHPHTAMSYNSLASCLFSKGMAADAEPLFRKGSEIFRDVFGEDHPLTAMTINNLARSLEEQGRVSDAEPLLLKSLEISQRVQGDDHPDVAEGYNNVARNMEAQGKKNDAEFLLRKALEIRQRVQGENHPATTGIYVNLANNLLIQGKTSEAERLLPSAIYSHEASRLFAAHGVERALLNRLNPRLLLAAIVHRKDPLRAWREVEFSLARGLLDQQIAEFSQLSADELAELTSAREQIALQQPQIGALEARNSRSFEDERLLEELIAERRKAQSRVAELAVASSARSVADASAIQLGLRSDEAILMWLDVRDKAGGFEEHLACVVRSSGDPRWERLPGTSAERAWSKVDSELPRQFAVALAGRGPQAEIDMLSKRLHAQRIVPVLEHLKGVNTLYVVPVSSMAGVPVEALTNQFRISYVPSGTFLARFPDRPKPRGTQLLAVGDPVFRRKATNSSQPPSLDDSDLPASGLLVLQVAPGSVAGQAGLQSGDVLVSYAGVEIESVERLTSAIQANSDKEVAAISYWREGVQQPLVKAVPSGKLGLTLAKEPAREAITNRRKTDAMLLALRGGDWKEIPGTRVEVHQITSLLGNLTKVLMDSDASEQALETLRISEELIQYRYLHFATHCEANQEKAFESVLILAQDQLAEDLASEPNKPFINGKLSAREVLEYWKLDAELVTLSACETAVGKVGGGDGQLGFAQAFLTAGARSVLLSLWKVDDSATALLMTRFYQNLLGKREGLSGPMSKSEALDEAKRWLRNLPSDEALKWTAGASSGVVRGDRGKGEVLKLVVPAVDSSATPNSTDKPYADPRYWAAFILIGEP